MVDIVLSQGEQLPTTTQVRYRDMGDGTHALVTAPGGLASNPLPVGMRREGSTTTVVIANGANVSDEIDFTEWSMLIIHMPAAWTAASIGFRVSNVSGGTFQPLYDQLGNLVQIAGPPVASQDYQAPPEIAGSRFIRLWSQNGAGANVNQGAARSIRVSVKA